jgi:hypothetical protein
MADAATTLYDPAPAAPHSQGALGAAIVPAVRSTPAPAAAAPASAPKPSAGEALYGNLESATPPAPPAQTKPTTVEKTIDALYGEKAPEVVLQVPDNIKALRKADQVRAVYGAQHELKSAFPDSVFEHIEGADNATKAAGAAEWREIFRDLGADIHDVKEFVMLSNQVDANPPDAKTVDEWRATAAKQLLERFGENASKALDAAKTLVARDPRVARWLNDGGLGNHPDVVLKLVRLAQNQPVKRGN